MKVKVTELVRANNALSTFLLYCIQSNQSLGKQILQLDAPSNIPIDEYRVVDIDLYINGYPVKNFKKIIENLEQYIIHKHTNKNVDLPVISASLWKHGSDDVAIPGSGVEQKEFQKKKKPKREKLPKATKKDKKKLAKLYAKIEKAENKLIDVTTKHNQFLESYNFQD